VTPDGPLDRFPWTQACGPARLAARAALTISPCRASNQPVHRWGGEISVNLISDRGKRTETQLQQRARRFRP
jgi:hypothetical protein